MEEKKTIDLNVNFGLAAIVIVTEILVYRIVANIIESKKN